MVIDLNDTHPANIDDPILFTVDGMFIDVRFLQSWNALSPNNKRRDEIFTDSKLEHP